VPAAIPGVGWSDHWSFWQEGYPAIMVTDTAPFRNPNYHQPTDKADTLDYDRMARVVHGLAGVVVDLGK
ncbi:MAG TPA: M28 family peptidase, partial [Alphaproteobacteria bacterium]|nr:M28 family peptidase [Alphaproteobacteria bacterium]